jgi:hypothetical protein
MCLRNKVRLVRGAENLTAIYEPIYKLNLGCLHPVARVISADCLDNVGSLTSHNPIGLHGLLRE